MSPNDAYMTLCTYESLHIFKRIMKNKNDVDDTEKCIESQIRSSLFKIKVIIYLAARLFLFSFV
jgi:hypothetical protein